MRTDHAFVITDKDLGLTVDIIEYLARKANRLGIQGREIIRVYIEEDTEGKHIYYDTNAPHVSVG